MRALTTRETLLAALTQASKSCDRGNHSVPILGCALLTVDADSRLSVIGTDMEVASTTTVDVASDETGSAAVPLKPLLAFTKALNKSTDVLIEATEDSESDISVTSSGCVATFKRYPSEDFPSVSGAVYLMSFTLDAAVLARLVEIVKPAISTEETRYCLNGIHIGVSEGELRFTTTDGHRLMLARAQLPDGVDPTWQGAILPRGALASLAGLLGRKPSGEVRVSVGDMRMRFVHGSGELVTKLIDGTFPDIDRVIPRNNSNVLTVDATECAATAKALDQLDNERSTAVKFGLSSDGCIMSFSDPEHGKSSTKLDGVTRYSGEAMEVGFQARYIRELLGVVSGAVEIRLSDASAPAVLTAISEPGWKAVLMPVRC